MSAVGPALGQIAALVLALVIAVPLLGRYLAHIYTSEKHLAVERRELVGRGVGARGLLGVQAALSLARGEKQRRDVE